MCHIILPPLPIGTRTLRDAVASTAAMCSREKGPSFGHARDGRVVETYLAIAPSRRSTKPGACLRSIQRSTVTKIVVRIDPDDAAASAQREEQPRN